MVSIEETVYSETRKQIREINTGRRKGNKLTLSKVVGKMLAIWNRAGSGKT